MSLLPIQGLLSRVNKRPHVAANSQEPAVSPSSKRRLIGSSDRDASPSSISIENGIPSTTEQTSSSSTASSSPIQKKSMSDAFASSSLFASSSSLSNPSKDTAASSVFGAASSTSRFGLASSSRAFFPKPHAINASSPTPVPPKQPRPFTYLASANPPLSKIKNQQQQKKRRSPTPYEDEDEEDIVERKVTVVDEEDDAYMRGGSQQQTDDDFNDGGQRFSEIRDDDEDLGPPASQASSYWEGPASQISPNISSSQVSRWDDDDDDSDLQLEPDEERHELAGIDEEIEDENEEDGKRGGARRSRSFGRAAEDFAFREATQEPGQVPSLDDFQNDEVPDIPSSRPQRRSFVTTSSLLGHHQRNANLLSDDQPASSSPQASPVPVVQQQQRRALPASSPGPAPREFDALIRAAVENSEGKLKELEAKYEVENLEGDAFVRRGDELLDRVSSLFEKVNAHIAERLHVFLDVGKEIKEHKEELVQRAERLDEHREVMLEYGKKPEL